MAQNEYPQAPQVFAPTYSHFGYPQQPAQPPPNHTPSAAGYRQPSPTRRAHSPQHFGHTQQPPDRNQPNQYGSSHPFREQPHPYAYPQSGGQVSLAAAAAYQPLSPPTSPRRPLPNPQLSQQPGVHRTASSVSSVPSQFGTSQLLSSSPLRPLPQPIPRSTRSLDLVRGSPRALPLVAGVDSSGQHRPPSRPLPTVGGHVPASEVAVSQPRAPPIIDNSNNVSGPPGTPKFIPHWRRALPSPDVQRHGIGANGNHSLDEHSNLGNTVNGFGSASNPLNAAISLNNQRPLPSPMKPPTQTPQPPRNIATPPSLPPSRFGTQVRSRSRTLPTPGPPPTQALPPRPHAASPTRGLPTWPPVGGAPSSPTRPSPPSPTRPSPPSPTRPSPPSPTRSIQSNPTRATQLSPARAAQALPPRRVPTPSLSETSSDDEDISTNPLLIRHPTEQQSPQYGIRDLPSSLRHGISGEQQMSTSNPGDTSPKYGIRDLPRPIGSPQYGIRDLSAHGKSDPGQTRPPQPNTYGRDLLTRARQGSLTAQQDNQRSAQESRPDAQSSTSTAFKLALLTLQQTPHPMPPMSRTNAQMGTGSQWPADLPHLPRVPGSPARKPVSPVPPVGGRTPGPSQRRPRAEPLNLDDAPPPSLYSPSTSPVPRSPTGVSVPTPTTASTAVPSPMSAVSLSSFPYPPGQQADAAGWQRHRKTDSASSTAHNYANDSTYGNKPGPPQIAVSGPEDDIAAGPMISVSGPDEESGPSISVSGPDNGPIISVSGPDSSPSIAISPPDGNKGSHTMPPMQEPRPTLHKGLVCGGCDGAIFGRIVSAMGARWHPGCFRCCVCHELLENLSSYEHEGRPYCHLDYHERFAPKCYHCGTAIVDERFITLDDPELGKRTYHELHFFCAECGDPFLPPQHGGSRSFSGDGVFVSEDDEDVGFTVYRGHPYCESCHVRLRLPKCKKCKKSIRDGMQAVEALGGKWCWECFVCASCEKPFDDPSFFLRDNKPFCERCFSVMIKNEL